MRPSRIDRDALNFPALSCYVNHCVIPFPMLKICKIDGCQSPVKARGLCGSHHKRWLRHGDPLGGTTYRGEVATWIERHTAYDGEECLMWPFSKDGYGYGTVNPRGGERKAHRLMCSIVHGPPPTPKHEAAHSCGNGHLGCVSPRHLRWATREENMADRLLHGGGNRGARHGMAKLSEDNVRAIRSMRGAASQLEIAKTFGISRTLVCLIHQRKRWQWLD